ncbi:hypothetical protein G7Y89_g8357 [Cudoniella acicularis]|uniref:Uncharacterized protein n=1 Tax=Cudoniella acicularis TaxID=354080 RepID=A0A8H4W3N4_9HELO|nr:hypothetical protein G7Y89_g8357 [Cudoniella acicularis]
MLPPIDDSILQSNPKFAALHKTLANNILNPDGSTKNHPAQKERDTVSAALKAARIRAAKSSLLLTAFRDLELSPSTTKSSKSSKTQQPPPSQTLPTELIELILLLTSRLSSTTITPKQLTLLTSTPQWTSLSTHLPQLSSLLSTHLQTQTLALARILSPTTNPSFLHRNIPKLCPTILDLQQQISSKKLQLHKQRSNLTTQTTNLLQAYQAAIALTIQLLETSKHGALSLERHYLTKASYLSLSIQQLNISAKEKSIKGQKMVYTEEVVVALERYKENLRDGRERLGERRREAERVLWGYGVGREDGEEKEKIMREIARVYGELQREVVDVGKDVGRLNGRAGGGRRPGR